MSYDGLDEIEKASKRLGYITALDKVRKEVRDIILDTKVECGDHYASFISTSPDGVYIARAVELWLDNLIRGEIKE